MVAVGVDGCAKGWIAAAIEGGQVVTVEYLSTIAALPARFPEAVTVGIDIPMGFPPPTGYPRPAEVTAKKLLGPLQNSVFLTPPRAVLEMPTHAEATALATELIGKGISQQSYALRNKIFEVQAWLPAAGFDAREVHPELSFLLLAGAPLQPSKRTWGGMAKRREALAAVGLEIRNVSADASRFGAADDVIDAVVAAWSADRVQRGEACSVPNSSESLAPGDVRIWG